MAILAVYLLNYVFGRATNQNLAYNWFAQHKGTLEQQFSVVCRFVDLYLARNIFNVTFRWVMMVFLKSPRMEI